MDPELGNCEVYFTQPCRVFGASQILKKLKHTFKLCRLQSSLWFGNLLQDSFRTLYPIVRLQQANRNFMWD